MKLRTRALAALSPLALTTSLLAAGPGWTLKPGTELVLTPAGGPASVVLRQGHYAFTTVTTMTITPDPLGQSTSRQWVLPAGSEITLATAPGLSLRRLDLARSVELEVISTTANPDPGAGNKYPPTLAPSLIAPGANSVDLSVDPDPGAGEKDPPT